MSGPRMSLEQAQQITRNIIALQKRWGKSAGMGQHNAEQLVEALLVLDAEANVDGPTKADITLANRQLAASKAREEGLKKRIAELDAQIVMQRNVIADQDGRLQDVGRESLAAIAELSEFERAVQVYSARVTEAVDYIEQNDPDSDLGKAVRRILRPVPEGEIQQPAG